jgi:HK97 family phage major capsid protein
MSDDAADKLTPFERVSIDVDDGDVQVRSASKREIEMRLLPWDTVVETKFGPEEFRRGSMADTPDDGLFLMGLEHEAHFGIGQAGEPVMTRHAVGRSSRFWEADDGPRAIFKVARTAAGDDNLALAEDRIYSGVSIEFQTVPGGTVYEKRGGRKVRVHNKVVPTGAALVRKGAYGDGAAVLSVRTDTGGSTSVATEDETVETTAPAVDLTPVYSRMDAAFLQFGDRFGALEESIRRSIDVPQPEARASSDLTVGRWVQTALKALTGERIPDAEMRVWADLITTDNLGVVPEAFSREIIGIIDASRPFLGSTRRIPTPAAGMTLNVPVLTTRPTAGVQVNEKDEVTSTETSITSAGFDAITIAGGGDISIQLLKRSDPSYLDLFLQLLAEAVSENAELEAITALLAAGVTAGTGTIDPNALVIGEAWTNANDVRQRADTMWLSSAAVAEFIDAKVDGTNAPLYSNLFGNFTVGGGPGGTISGLRPVHVPALDSTGSDVVIGPSRGFVWAEDGAFTLQVDVPSKAGRDVALVVIDWYAPLYAAAFTEWSL